jgi:two-component system, NarL family, sensor kinase
MLDLHQASAAGGRARPRLPPIGDVDEVATAILDLDGILLAANARWYQLPIAARSALAQRQDCDGDTSAELLVLSAGLRAIFRGARSEFRLQYRGETADSSGWYEARAARIGQGVDGFVIVTHEDITESKRLEDELRRVSRQLIKTQGDERRRIAREIHDTTVQNLVGAALQLDRVSDQTISGDDARLALREVRQLLELSMRELRTLSYLLHPPMLDELGLVPAIRWYARGFVQRSGIRVEIAAPKTLPRLDPDAESSLFRIVQEALGNVHRHSGSPDARITLRAYPQHLLLEIADHGRGMHKAAASDGAAMGVGIAGMRLRLRQIGGALDISSGRRGTILRATVPFAAAGAKRRSSRIAQTTLCGRERGVSCPAR